MPAHPSCAKAAIRAVFAAALVVAVAPRAHAGDKPTAAPALRTPVRATAVDGAAHPTYVARDPGATAGVPVVYLHGIHGRPENGCPWFTTPAFGDVLCPVASHAEPTRTFSWSSNAADEQVILQTLALSDARGAGTPLLVGFSQGAYVAARLVPRLGGRLRGLVLIGADAQLDSATLGAAGITRVALVAGDYDAASAPMKRTAASLTAAGFGARFVSLGRVGHTYVPESSARLEELRAALAWAAGVGGASS